MEPPAERRRVALAAVLLLAATAALPACTRSDTLFAEHCADAMQPAAAHRSAGQPDAETTISATAAREDRSKLRARGSQVQDIVLECRPDDIVLVGLQHAGGT